MPLGTGSLRIRQVALESNRSPTETPTFNLSVAGIAVSVTDKRLHVFGHLSNGFPQVLHVSEDGARVERADAQFIGLEDGENRSSYAQYIDELWLPSGNGHGALHFRGAAGALPPDVPASVRLGRELLRIYPEHPPAMLVAVDEIKNVAWIAQGGGGAVAPIAIDCLAARAVCWFGGEHNVQLRDESGRVLATAQPARGVREDSSWAMAIYADPKDGSAWALLARSARLLHVGVDGTIVGDLKLTEPMRAYSIRATADFENRAIWFTRRGSTALKTELVRIDLEDDALTVVAEDVPSLPHLAADLRGGVWVVSRSQASRIDRNGRVLVTVRLDSQ